MDCVFWLLPKSWNPKGKNDSFTTCDEANNMFKDFYISIRDFSPRLIKNPANHFEAVGWSVQ